MHQNPNFNPSLSRKPWDVAVWRVSIGRKIALHRRGIGLTQRAFADKVNISCSYLSKLENGSAIEGLTLFVLESIAVGLDVPSAELLTLSLQDENRAKDYMYARIVAPDSLLIAEAKRPYSIR